MSIVIFVIILGVLIMVHEAGHFLVAKQFGIRVDEFGLGFPPRAKKLFTWKQTLFTLNWLPFGGFVKIFGENPAEVEPKSVSSDSFQSQNRCVQASVLVSGVAGNFIFAWLLISLGFMTGLPAPAGFPAPVENTHTVVTTVLPLSPAATVGLKSGDVILSLARGQTYSKLMPETASLFIAESAEPITFTVERGDDIFTKVVTPEASIIKDRLAVGIVMDVIGTVKLPPHEALWYGLKATSELTLLTGQTIGSFILQALNGKADLSSVTGPVGMVGMVENVRELGFAYLLTFAALISINLSVINLLPFPALDGGRLLFVAFEAISRRRIPPRVFNTLNTIGFVILVFLMLLITTRDIRNIF